MQSKLISYLQSQRREAQWDFLLQSLIHEVSSALGSDGTRRLMVKTGMRAGLDMPLPGCESVEQMQAAANQHWQRLGWGMVTFIEHRDSLDIEHAYAPEKSAVPGGVAAFLEGVYQQWFVSLGAGEHLQVRQCDSADNEVLLYRLAG